MNDLGGFLFDGPEDLVPDGCSRPPVSKTDSSGDDQEEIEKYVESVKRRAQESNRLEGSSMQDKSVIPRHSELWMLPVPVHSFHVILMIG